MKLSPMMQEVVGTDGITVPYIDFIGAYLGPRSAQPTQSPSDAATAEKDHQ